MAAATVEAKSFKSEAVKLWEAGKISRAYAHPSSTDLGEDGDKLKFFQMPKGAKVLDGLLSVPDLDSGATAAIVLTVNVTNGTTTKILIDASAAGQAGGLGRPSKTPATENAIGYIIPDDGYWVEIEVITSAQTEAAGAVFLSVDYTLDLEQGEAP